MTMKRAWISYVVLLCLGSTGAMGAQHAGSASEEEPADPQAAGSRPAIVVQAPDEIVTAARTAQTADETLAAVTVIEREDIERQQAQTVEDALRALPGIDFANNGGLGKGTFLFLRGTESDHLLVLIDGVKVGSATTGTAAFQHIPVDQVQRIEVVRGPRSSLYGSEAIGGVIQIFTRKGGGKLKPHFSVGGGSFDTYSASAGVSGGGERGWFNLTASGVASEGFNACDGKPFPDGGGCFTIEPDADGYRNHAATLRAGYRFESGLMLDTHVLHSAGTTEFDGQFQNETDFVQQVVGATLAFFPVEAWRIGVTGGRSRDEADNLKDGVKASVFDTRRDSASIQNDVSIGSHHLLTLGGDFQEDRVAGTTEFAVTSRENTGAFLQYQADFSAHDLQLSGRRDDNEQFGAFDTQGAAWGYNVTETMRLTASVGTAFKAPTFNELYFPGFGNPDLDPERSRSVELGLGHPGAWSLQVYETTIEDLISFDAATFAPANIDKARIQGLEATSTSRFDSVRLGLYLTLLQPENRSPGDNEGNVLPRRAQESLRVDASHQVASFTYGATLVAKGKRYDDLANTVELKDYARLDLRAEWRFAQNWRLQGKIENAGDEDYETAAFFNQPGRSAFVTLRYRP